MHSLAEILECFSKINKEVYNMPELPVLEQFVDDVLDYSSQYGGELSISYTVHNLRGPPTNFPDYGDYPQNFVMKTYGKWWDEAPAGQVNYVPQNSSILAQDFVEISFGRFVCPMEVSIYETFNPGAVVRIWARTNVTWTLLWEGEPQVVCEMPRKFSPPIKQINIPVKVLRIEFNHSHLTYYTELDGILLTGYLHPNAAQNIEAGSILDKVIEANLHEAVGTLSALTDDNEDSGPLLGYFHNLPEETVLSILKYLDMKSLCRCCQVNTHFNRLALDCILYKNVNLQPYWNCVDTEMLNSLSGRCRFLQKLDISWCGAHSTITPAAFNIFLKSCCSNLTHLRMNCCNFADDSVLMCIAETCQRLQELCLRSIRHNGHWVNLSSLTKLKRLDLYGSHITASAVVSIIYSNPGLLHLNVGSCINIHTMDDVAITLGKYCPNLISVDFWKSYTLTPSGIRGLGCCKQLQELDFGWCLQLSANGDWLSWLPGTELRKVFLGALRGVSDRDLRSLIRRAPRLSQLDLLGVRAVSSDMCEEILEGCHHLRLLDISFCDQIHAQKEPGYDVIYIVKAGSKVFGGLSNICRNTHLTNKNSRMETSIPASQYQEIIPVV